MTVAERLLDQLGKVFARRGSGRGLGSLSHKISGPLDHEYGPERAAATGQTGGWGLAPNVRDELFSGLRKRGG
jgi:hypothetical protein